MKDSACKFEDEIVEKSNSFIPVLPNVIINTDEGNFVGFYAEDPSCPDTTEKTFPVFVKCSGPGAEIPRDGASCECGPGSQVITNIRLFHQSQIQNIIQ